MISVMPFLFYQLIKQGQSRFGYAIPEDQLPLR